MMICVWLNWCLWLCIAVAAWQGQEGDDSIRKQACRVSISRSGILTDMHWCTKANTEVLIYEFRHFAAVEARFLRASFSAFVDLMGLVTKLVEEYGVDKEGHSWGTISCMARLWALWIICISGNAFRFGKLMYQCICSWLVQTYLEQWFFFCIFMWIQLYSINVKCTYKNRVHPVVNMPVSLCTILFYWV
jgi:EKC/KEOPS complex subunit PCC1/LAGE3